ncbi:hypothetical protein [Alkalicoccus chagannorensis]|uniref:hypothetical protein n=1 Tax=Alkalicoccus chagannorensis TaxID=427072 RepID=UPI0004203944|nr:hypothetical protein [Alkalicoccus chagannorensis]
MPHSYTDLQPFLLKHPVPERTYTFWIGGTYHRIDSDFLLQELLDSPPDDQLEFLELLQPYAGDPASLHECLFQLAVLYVQANGRTATDRE